MAKTKQKGRSEIEELRGYVREIEKENRSLKKELRQFQKYETRSQDTEYAGDSEDTMEPKHKPTRCDDCAKGFYQEFEIMGKCYGTCTTCQHRKRLR